MPVIKAFWKSVWSLTELHFFKYLPVGFHSFSKRFEEVTSKFILVNIIYIMHNIIYTLRTNYIHNVSTRNQDKLRAPFHWLSVLFFSLIRINKWLLILKTLMLLLSRLCTIGKKVTIVNIVKEWIFFFTRITVEY